MNKFRVYDKQEKKLYKPDTMGELFYLFALTMDGRLGRFNEDLDKYETCDPDRYAVEFSTGLKDKNGVEIYEGDMVRFETILNVFIEIEYSSDKKEIPPKYIESPVIYKDGMFSFKWMFGYEGKEVGFEEVEIIGNIHGETDDKI